MKEKGTYNVRLKRLFTERAIKGATKRIAAQIDKDYAGHGIVMIVVLKGSFVFAADMMRAIKLPVTVDFIHAASYGDKTTPDKVRLTKDVEVPIHNRHVLLVDDIVDTGRTTRLLLRHLRRRKPASLRLCSLLDKPSRRIVPVEIDYLGFTVPDLFIVGYGIDFAEEYRQLPEIYGILDEE